MGSSLNIQLTDVLRQYVDMRASDNDIYSTPSEYIRDLIRKDMESHNKTFDHEIATMLLATRNSTTSPLEENYIAQKREKLKQRTSLTQNNLS